MMLRMLGVLWRRRVLCMCLLRLVRILLVLRMLLLVVETSHAGQGQRVRRRAGRALSVLINGLAGWWISILRGRRWRSMAGWQVIVRPVVHGLESRRGGSMFLVLRRSLLLLRLARASCRRRM